MAKKIIAVLLVAAMLTMDIPSKLMPGTISVQAAETGTIEAKETETEEIQGKAGQAEEQESEKNETVQTENEQTEEEQTEEEQAMEETSKHIKQASEPIGLEGTHILGEDENLRDECSKTFQRDDGLYTTVMYARPLHYLDEKTEKWMEIDNTLQEEKNGRGESYYTNAANDFDVILPKSLNGGDEVKISQGGYKLSFILEGTESDAVQLTEDAGIIQDRLSAKIETKEKIEIPEILQERETVLEENNDEGAADSKAMEDFVEDMTLESGIVYENAYENTDLIYSLQGKSLKESIILSTAPKENRLYTYLIQADGLRMILNDDQSVSFKSKNKAIFEMPAPYMYDAANNISEDIKVTLKEVSGGYRLTYEPSFDWLTDKERVYPVTVDPTVEAASDSLISDTYVSSADREKNFGGSSYLSLEQTDSLVKDIYLKVNDLPKSEHPVTVTNAKLKFNLVKPPPADTVRSSIYQVTSAWNVNTITYNDRPANDTRKVDYTLDNINGREVDGQLVYYTASLVYDITSLANKWYNKLSNNYGVMISCESEGSLSNIFSSRFSPSHGPSLEVTYKNLLGAKAGGSCKTIDMGSSGKVYLDDYSGNTCIVREDIGMDGNIMPVQISMVYNSYAIYPGYWGDASPYGLGWKTNYSQKLSYHKNHVGSIAKEYYEYLSDTGTFIYFEKTNNKSANEIFKDTGDSGYKLSVDINNLEDYTKQKITDPEGNTYYFDGLGRLKKIVGDYPVTKSVTATSNLNPVTDEPGVIRIDYPTSGSNKSSMMITRITDGARRKYNFNYDKYDRLSSIQFDGDKSTHTVRYGYETANGFHKVIKVWYNNVIKAMYISNGMAIKELRTPDGRYMLLKNRKLDFSTCADGIQIYGTDGKIYQDIIITRAAGQTKYEDSITGDTETIQFDEQGNVTCMQDGKGYAVFGLHSDSGSGPNLLGNMSEQFKPANNRLFFEDLKRDFRCRIKKDIGLFNIGRTIEIPSGIAHAITYPLAKLEQGTYTFSTYTKGNGAILGVAGDGFIVENESISSGTEDTWRRLYKTIRVLRPTRVILSISNNGRKTVWCDGIQFERGGLGEFNMVYNGDFNGITNQGRIIGWERIGIASGVIRQTDPQNASPVSKDYISIDGDVNSPKVMWQLVPISGKSGDEFTFGAYAKAASLPTENNKNRKFNIQAKVIRAPGVDSGQFSEDKVYTVGFNSYSPDWQYALDGFETEYPYSGIELSLHYDYQLNTAYFDAIQLYKIPFASNSVFNDDGNLDYTYEVSGNQETSNSRGSNPDEANEIKDSYGRVISSTTKKGITTTNKYDNFNNVLSTGTKNGSTEIKVENTYTPDGNQLTSQTDEAGNTITYAYDTQLGLLKSTEDANKGLVGYAYDSDKRLIKISQNVSGLINGTSLGNQYSYDAGDNLSSITHNGFSYNFQYDPLGVLKKVITPIGDMVSYEYSSIADGNTLDNVTYGNGQSIQYEYSDRGILNAVNSGGISLYKYYYDVKSKAAAKIDNVNNIKTILAVNEDGNEVITQTGINGNGMANQYYSLKNKESGDIMQTQIYNGNTYVALHKKDKDERHVRTRWTVGDSSFEESVRYDSLGRLNAKSLSNDQLGPNAERYGAIAQTLNQTYKYVNVGQGLTSNQVSQISLSNLSGYDKVLNYEYDNRGYLSNANGIRYTYDEAGQLIRVDSPTKETTTYQYDKGGNLRDVKTYAYKEGTLGTPLNSISYGYHSQWKDLLVSYNGSNITYDGIGNPLDYYNGTTFTWKMGRQLASATHNGKTTKYKYDDDGLRTEKSTLSATIKYVYMDGVLTAQSGRDHFFYFYYDGNGEVIGFNYSNGSTSGVYFYVKNLQGDIISILDSYGSEVVSYEYDEWGKLLNISGSEASALGKKNPFRYRSYYYDEETGFYYLQSRYYDPGIGRFVNADDPDVLAFSGTDVLGTNLFAYCGNNPVNKIDSDGYYGTPIQWACAAIGGYIGWRFGHYVAKKFGYEKSNWQYWTIRAGVTVGGAVIGWFTGKAMLKVITKFLLTKPARMAKLPGVVLWFLGLGGASGAIANEVFLRNVSHIFSDKHVVKGLMKLGSSQRDIFNKAFNIVSSKITQAANGSNQIHTYIKGYKVTIRFYFKDGKFGSFNIFMGWAKKIVGKLLK